MTILLRKLTLKSKIGFGYENIKNSTVQQLIDLRKFKNLREMYFLLSMITFTDDVLDQIGIKPEYRIAKPGKDKQYYKSIEKKLFVDVKMSVQEIVLNKTLRKMEDVAKTKEKSAKTSRQNHRNTFFNRNTNTY